MTIYFFYIYGERGKGERGREGEGGREREKEGEREREKITFEEFVFLNKGGLCGCVVVVVFVCVCVCLCLYVCVGKVYVWNKISLYGFNRYFITIDKYIWGKRGFHLILYFYFY